MRIEILKSKIHRATITESNLNYIGSITIDEELMDAVELVPNERVHIYDIDNGKRFDTYVIKGERGTGQICMNGAAARLVHKGDRIIIVSYCSIEFEKAKNHFPKIVVVNENNEILERIT